MTPIQMLIIIVECFVKEQAMYIARQETILKTPIEKGFTWLVMRLIDITTSYT